MTPKPAKQSTIEAVNGGPAILITRRECWYFSHRNKLLRRGFPISIASERAIKVARRVERCLRRPAYLQCPYCEWWYRLRPDAIALEIDGDTAIVRPGFVETCPACYSESWAGDRLVIRRPQKEDVTAD